MKKIYEAISRLRSLIGEETLLRELEGIYTKHQGLSRRTRKPGRVELCARQVLESGERVDPFVVAEYVRSWGLSQASVYRLIHILNEGGVHLRAIDVIRASGWKKSGIY